MNGNIVLEEGSLLDLNCSATACPTPNIKWTKVGVPGVLVSQNGNMATHSFSGGLKKQDTGNYTCTADNGGPGSLDAMTVYVNVTCK